jgi:voltage-gated sodium channel
MTSSDDATVTASNGISGLPSGKLSSELGERVWKFRRFIDSTGLSSLLEMGISTSSISGGLGSWLTSGHGHHHHQKEWHKNRMSTAQVLNARGFKLTMAMVILFNLGLVVKETDLRAQGHDMPTYLTIVNLSLILFYVLEILLRIYVLRRKFWSRWSNLFDLFVVVADIGAGLVTIIHGSTAGPSISLLRILRLGRMLRVFRVLNIFRELSMLIHGLASAFKAILWAVVMIFLVLLVWCILSVEWIHPVVQEILQDHGNVLEDCQRCPRAFSTVFDSMLTFMQTIVAGDSWGNIAVPVIEREPYTAIIFLGTQICVQLGLLNLILAVIVDRAREAREEDVELVLSEKAERFKHEKSRLLRMCVALDVDNSGYLTRDELLKGFETHQEFADLLRYVNITKQDLRMFFDVLDTDSSGEVSYKEFVEQLYMMKTQETKTLMMYNLCNMRRELSDLKETLVDFLAEQGEEQCAKIMEHLAVSGKVPSSPSKRLKRKGQQRTLTSRTVASILEVAEEAAAAEHMSKQQTPLPENSAAAEQVLKVESDEMLKSFGVDSQNSFHIKSAVQEEFRCLQDHIDESLTVTMAKMTGFLSKQSSSESHLASSAELVFPIPDMDKLISLGELPRWSNNNINGTFTSRQGRLHI